MRWHNGDNMLGRKAHRDIRRDQIRFAAAIIMAGAMFGRSQSADAQAAGARTSDANALSALQAAADQGDAHAQAQLGCRYATGDGVSADETQAMSWMTKAMVQQKGALQGGRPAAETLMGVCLDNAHRPGALEWWIKSSDDGYIPAEQIMVAHYLSGIGVPKNKEKALSLLENVIAAGNASADAHQLAVTLRKEVRAEAASAREPSNDTLIALFRDAYRKFGNDLASRSMGDIVASGYNKQQARTGSQFRADDGATRALNGIFSAFGGENIMKARGAQFVNLADTGIITIKSRQLLEGNWIVYVNVRPRGEDRHWIEKMVVTRQDDRWVASLPAAAPIEQQ